MFIDIAVYYVFMLNLFRGSLLRQISMMFRGVATLKKPNATTNFKFGTGFFSVFFGFFRFFWFFFGFFRFFHFGQF